MADNSYASKSVRPIAAVHLISGLISVAIGVFTSWNQDHTVITELKPNGLPLWGGILFILTGCMGILSTRGPKKYLIYGFMILCAMCVIVAFVMYRVLLPLLLSGGKDIPWNLCIGSYMALVAIICIISMKGMYLCLKATLMYNNCCQKSPPRRGVRRRHSSVELTSSVSRSTTVVDEGRDGHRQARRVSSPRNSTSPPTSSGPRSHRQPRPVGSHTRSHNRRERERSPRHSQSHQTPAHQTPVRIDERPPPPPYQTMKLPHLPAYHEVVRSPPPPPYTEKEEDT